MVLLYENQFKGIEKWLIVITTLITITSSINKNYRFFYHALRCIRFVIFDNPVKTWRVIDDITCTLTHNQS